MDAAPEMLDICRRRVASDKLRTIEADLFDWRADGSFDVVFFAFWLSHVPPRRFEALWDAVAAALAPGGRVFFVDSLYSETSRAKDHERPDPQAAAPRKLNDGRQFRVVKTFYDPAHLAERLARLGWDVTVERTAEYFLYGFGRRAGTGPTAS